MRMKAQSELAGDRKRRAEMARPAAMRVTLWMTGVSEMISNASKAIAISAPEIDLPKVTFAPALTETLSRISKTTNNEVNHRPAG